MILGIFILLNGKLFNIVVVWMNGFYYKCDLIVLDIVGGDFF